MNKSKNREMKKKMSKSENREMKKKKMSKSKNREIEEMLGWQLAGAGAAVDWLT